MTALELINHLGVIPLSVERPCEQPTVAEIRRWLDQKSILVNGTRPKAKDEIEFPITQLVFFPNGKRRTTVL